MWKAVGILIALAVAIAAWNRGRAAGGHYDADTYGMTPQTHRRYALGGLVLGVVVSLFLKETAPRKVQGGSDLDRLESRMGSTLEG